MMQLKWKVFLGVWAVGLALLLVNPAWAAFTTAAAKFPTQLDSSSLPIKFNDVAIASNNANANTSTAVAVADGGFIYRTTDRVTWTKITSPTTQNLNGVVFKDPLVGIAVGNGGTIITTDDGGLTWTARTSGTSSNLYDVDINSNGALAVGAGGIMFRSTNNGTTWTSITSQITQDLNGCALSGTLAVAVGNKGNAQSSSNWDTSFTFILDSTNTGNHLQSVAWGGAVAYAVGDGGTVIKKDTAVASVSWTPQTSGTTNNLRGVGAMDAKTVALAGDGILLKTTNSGTNWTADTLNSGITFNKGGSSGGVEIWFAGNVATVVRWTGTGTANWAFLTHLGVGIPTSVFVDKPSSGLNVYILMTNGTILQSGDYGATFAEQVVANYGIQHNDIYVASSTAWVCRGDGKVIKYNPDQTSTTISVSANALNAIDGTSSTNIWTVGGLGSVYQSTNGSSFTAVNPGNIFPSTFTAMDIRVVDANTIWIVGNDATKASVYLSTNGGTNFTKKTDITGVSSATVLHLWARDGTTAWVVDGTNNCRKTTDAAATWNSFTISSKAGTVILDITGLDENHLVVGGDDLLYSLDGASTWTSNGLTGIGTIKAVGVGLGSQIRVSAGVKGGAALQSTETVKIGFTNNAFKAVDAGDRTGAVKAQIQDSNGNAVRVVFGDVNLDVTSDQSATKFYATASSVPEITITTVSQNQSTASDFYFTETRVGSTKITVASTSAGYTWTSGAQTETITSTATKLQILLPGETASPGSPTGKTGNPTAQTAGTAFNVTVNAVNKNWVVDTSNSRSVHLTSSDSNAVLSTDTMMRSGTVTLTVTFKTGGGATQTVTASDVSSGTALTSNTSSNVTANSAAATKLQILQPGETAAPGTSTGKTGTPTAQTAGTAFNVTVNAVDDNWNLVNTVTDTVAISLSDTNSTAPAAAALVAGTKTFSVTIKQAGSQTVTASDSSNSQVLSNQSSLTINPGVFTKLQILVPGETAAPGSASGKGDPPISLSAGTAYDIKVNAVDANWNVVNTVTDTVGIKSSDPNATLPSSSALVAGTKTLSVTPKTAGSQTFTVLDITDGTKTLNTSPSVTVSAGAAAKLQVLLPGESAAPGTSSGKTGTATGQTAGTAFNVTVNAVDANWNNVTTVTDTVQITSSDPGATLPANAALTAGTGTFSVKLNTKGDQTVTVTDVTDPAKTSNISAAVTVGTGAYTKLNVSVSHPTVTAGSDFTITFTAQDGAGNTATSTNTPISVSVLKGSSGTVPGTGTLPTLAGSSFTNGTATFTVHYDVAETIRIKGLDTQNSIFGVSTPITVNAGSFVKLQTLLPGETGAPATSSGKTGTPTAQTAGTAFNVTVNAVDVYFNVVSTVADTVQATPSDANATSSAATALAAGTRTFQITPKTAGSVSVTASDISDNNKTASKSADVTVNAGAFSKLQTLLPGESAVPGTISGKTGVAIAQTPGTPFTVKVNAVDANWNLVSTVSDKVHFTSTDSAAGLPADAPLSSGTGSFTVTLNTKGNQTITASNATNSGITSNTSSAIAMGSGAYSKLDVAVDTTAAGNQISLTITAQDGSGNIVSTLKAPLTISVLKDASGTTPGSGTPSVTSANLTAGRVVVTEVYTVAETIRFKVRDTDNLIEGISPVIIVAAAEPSKIAFEGFSASHAAGTTVGASIRLFDKFNNKTTSRGSSTITVKVDDGNGRLDLSPTATFANSQIDLTILSGQEKADFYLRLPLVGTQVPVTATGVGSTVKQSLNLAVNTSVKFAIENKADLVKSGVTAGKPIEIKGVLMDTSTNAPITTFTDLVIALQTSNSDGLFRTTAEEGKPGITSTTLPAGQSRASAFYHVDKKIDFVSVIIAPQSSLLGGDSVTFNSDVKAGTDPEIIVETVSFSADSKTVVSSVRLQSGENVDSKPKLMITARTRVGNVVNKVEARIDGIVVNSVPDFRGDVDLMEHKLSAQGVIFRQPTLTPGTHTLAITADSDKNSNQLLMTVRVAEPQVNPITSTSVVAGPPPEVIRTGRTVAGGTEDTVIAFELKKDIKLILTVYNMTGQIIHRCEVDGIAPYTTCHVDGKEVDLPAGLYVYTFTEQGSSGVLHRGVFVRGFGQ